MKLFPSLLYSACLTALCMNDAAAVAQDQAACQYMELARLPLHYTGPGLQVTMDGTINGTPAVMLADTGASRTALTRTGTEKRGLHLRPTGNRTWGIGGVSDMYTTRVDDFAAGPAKSSRGYVEVFGDMGSAPAFDAIVGAPYLLQADMELNLAQKEARFFRPRNCDHNWLAYWSKDAVAIPFELNDMGEKPVNPPFTIEINGAKMLAIIDSGAWRTSIDAHAAERAGIKVGSPDVVSIGSSTGVGSRRVSNWRAKVATIRIGDEVVHDGEVAVMDTKGQLNVDVLLGDDFLRAHRVLFAMSQRRIYLSYVGGDVFGVKPGIEPWVQKEADAGNPDAQMRIADLYQAGNGVPRDPGLAAQWLDKAAAQGHPRARLVLARRAMHQGQYAAAAGQLKAALEQMPAERFGALWLYLARVRTGAQEAGKKELEATFARTEDDAWPKPIADYYLGHIDAAELLARARQIESGNPAPACDAGRYIAELQAAQKGEAVPDPVAECTPVRPAS